MTTAPSRARSADGRSAGGATTDAPPIVVQQTLSPPNGTTRFVDHMVASQNPRVTHRYFSWRSAILTRYDVFHVHWPELTIRAASPARRFARRRLLDALLLRARITRTPIVRHLHNLEPHEAGSAAEKRALRRIDEATDLYIRLNPTTVPPTDRPVVTALHGHYRDAYAQHVVPPTVPGRLLYFGIIRPYKGVDRLATVFSQLTDPDLALRIVGSAPGDQKAMVEAHAARDERISADLRFVSDAELAGEVGQAELVILPYHEMHNSGTILVALSLDRPVLAPRTPPNEALAAEVGPGWVILFDGELTPDVIRDAVATVRTGARDARPDLSARDGAHIDQVIESAYRSAIAQTRAR